MHTRIPYMLYTHNDLVMQMISMTLLYRDLFNVLYPELLSVNSLLSRSDVAEVAIQLCALEQVLGPTSDTDAESDHNRLSSRGTTYYLHHFHPSPLLPVLLPLQHITDLAQSTSRDNPFR